MASSTSSFRITDELKAQLEATAHRMNKGKNRIINEALKEYLDRHNPEWLRAEARRQSLLASKHKWKDEEFWEKLGAETWDE
ncbi:MAG TPA: ribbon-helix-helix protein, CopG family [Bryobacteraceae bacterium]